MAASERNNSIQSNAAKNKKKVSLTFQFRARSLVVSDFRSETKGSQVRVRLLAVCRGELSAAIALLMSKCL